MPTRRKIKYVKSKQRSIFKRTNLKRLRYYVIINILECREVFKLLKKKSDRRALIYEQVYIFWEQKITLRLFDF